MPQCGTCHGWGTVPAAGNNAGRVPCPEANCHAGVVYDEPVIEANPTRPKLPEPPPPIEKFLLWLGIIAFGHVVIYFLTRDN